MRSSLLRLIRTALAPAWLLATACGGYGSEPETSTSAQPTIDVVDDRFDPSTTNVGVGQTVTWTWLGSNEHNITWVDANGPAASATQRTGTYDRRFAAAGTFTYYCTVHGAPTSGMRGAVVVSSAGDGGENPPGY